MMAYEAYIGRSETMVDHVSAAAITRLAATLDLAPDIVAPGGFLPPLWHWMLFQTWVAASALGPDGHPRRGGFLPPIHDLARRMWAGGRVALHAPLAPAMKIQRTSTILAIREKSGGSGRLVFVTLRHDIAGPDGVVAISEEQDIVYRGAEGAAVRPAIAAPTPPPGAFSRVVTPDAVMLFRYSALTGNGHRIHYDLDYVTREEGYPGLVVHGPLQATLLVDLLRRHLPQGKRLARLHFRGQRPAFHDRALTLVGWREGDGYHLESRDAEGATCMSAEAELA
jgi:3-methylfumaryl-CoA hydratase